MKLKYKFQILIVLLIIFVTILEYIAFVSKEKNRVIKLRENVCLALIDNFKDDIIYGTYINNKSFVKNILDRYGNINFIDTIIIKKFGKKFSQLNDNINGKLVVKKILKCKENKILKIKPCNVEVEIFFNIKDIKKMYQDLTRTLIFVLIIIIIFTCLIVEIFYYKFIEPVDYLIRKIEKARLGIYETIEVGNSNDFKNIFDSYNDLVKSLEEKDREIVEKINQLEESNENLKEKIYEIQMLQNMVIRQEKLASLGTITSGIAHEINNPVAAIRGISEMIVTVNPDNEYSDQFEKIIKHCDRIKDIIRNIRNFNKEIDNDELEKVAISDIIEDVTELCENAKILTNDIKIIGNYPKNKYKILCIKNQIFQVFQNLITNAAQALNGKGSITIDIFKKNGYMEIDFYDDGPGIPVNYRPKIFDPFFSTKGTKGTGLGLYITYNILKQHNGNIELINSDKGAHFRIKLPLEI